MDEDQAGAGSAYAMRVGTRLRAIRKQKRLSLQDVEASSTQEFKASVLGAYERGERAISVPRLQRLARFYNVPVDQLLPPDGEMSDVIDLVKLEQQDDTEASMLARFLGSIQVQRGDFNGRMLTIRRDDLRAIAAMLDTSPDIARRKLEERGLRLHV